MMSTLPPGSTVGTGHIRFTPLAGTAGAIRVGVLQVTPSSSEKLTNASSDSGSCPTQIAPAGSPVGQATTPGIGAGLVRCPGDFVSTDSPPRIGIGPAEWSRGLGVGANV